MPVQRADERQAAQHRQGTRADPEIALDVAAQVVRAPDGRIEAAEPAAADQEAAARLLLQRQMPVGERDQVLRHRRRRFGDDHLLHRAGDRQVEPHHPADARRPRAGGVHHAAGDDQPLGRLHVPCVALARDRLHLGAAQQPGAGTLCQLQHRQRAAQRIAVALRRDEVGADHVLGQRRRQRAQFVGAEHVALDAPASFHRRLAAQPIQPRRVLRQHQAAFGADAEVLAGLGGDLLPQRDRARRERQCVRRLAAILRCLVGEVVGQQLHVQAAGIRGARRHAGLVAFGQQHIDAVAREEIRAAQAGEAAAHHQHIAAPRLLRQRRQADADAAAGRQFQQRRLELGRLEHQRCGRHRAQRRARCGERRSRPAQSGQSRAIVAAQKRPWQRPMPARVAFFNAGSEVQAVGQLLRAGGRRSPPRSGRRWFRRSSEPGRRRIGRNSVHSASWNASARRSAAARGRFVGRLQAKIARCRQARQPAACHRDARAAE